MIDIKNYNSQIENNTYSEEYKNKLAANQTNLEISLNSTQNESLLKDPFQNEIEKVNEREKNTAENDSDEEYELSDELREEIEKRVDLQFQDKYKEMSEYYENRIFDLLNEQEKVFTKSEMIKAKINTLENYLKYYCKINGIDFDELISDSN